MNFNEMMTASDVVFVREDDLDWRKIVSLVPSAHMMTKCDENWRPLEGEDDQPVYGIMAVRADGKWEWLVDPDGKPRLSRSINAVSRYAERLKAERGVRVEPWSFSPDFQDVQAGTSVS